MTTTSTGRFRGFGLRERFSGPGASQIMTPSQRRERIDTINSTSDRVPFVGVTTNGKALSGLYGLEPTGISTKPIKDAAEAFIALLSDAQRADAMYPAEGIEWSMWHNAFELLCGTSMTEMTPDQREAFLNLVKSALSPSGFETARNAMRLNAALGEIVGNEDLKRNWVGEWNYGARIFGTPSMDAPWGWQLHGHHLIISCFVLRDQIVMTPAFVGGEPAMADEGTYAGISILNDEEKNGLSLMHGLSQAQRNKATLYPSMLSKDLPPALGGSTDGRHLGGAFKDNLIVPYQGVRADDFSSGQRELLLRLIGTYIGRMQAGHAAVKLDEVKKHLDETHFAWIGQSEADSVFYYKIHSPVLFIEFDHHPGIFLANDNPEKFHIHTIVRTPNGNDYGRDLLRQHYEQEHKSAPEFLTLQGRPTRPTS